MTERQPGYYWVRWSATTGWVPAEWDGRFLYSDSCGWTMEQVAAERVEIGPRLMNPDEEAEDLRKPVDVTNARCSGCGDRTTCRYVPCPKLLCDKCRPLDERGTLPEDCQCGLAHTMAPTVVPSTHCMLIEDGCMASMGDKCGCRCDGCLTERDEPK